MSAQPHTFLAALRTPDERIHAANGSLHLACRDEAL